MEFLKFIGVMFGLYMGMSGITWLMGRFVVNGMDDEGDPELFSWIVSTMALAFCMTLMIWDRGLV